MNRSTNSVAIKKRKKKILKRAKGFYGSRSKLYTIAKNSVEKSLIYSYIGRKKKKKDFKKIWIKRINAFSNLNGLNYSKFIYLLKKNKIYLNKKCLSFLITNYLKQFTNYIKKNII
ncbi:MAG: 50S ribosomal protein L20 [Candidatus Shikimatogenerans sp. AspAUS03]|uniref:Large ribosomal subunit protein bL20 n=1 Tax=Candidatus Shikimatogenerans sp. AspAUS03 TaxID=3158563 RepID=A0AAU7QTB4_9FLAO